MRRRRLHLLEVGVRWPPETFVGWKLEGLADRGMKVTVASKAVFDAGARLRGVELFEVPSRATGTPLRALAVPGLRLLTGSPRRLVRLWRAVRRVPPQARHRFGGTRGLLGMLLPLARFRPDVVHFEWNTAAVDYLPLFDVWGCPVVTSCRGSDISVYPHSPTWSGYASRLPEVLARARWVHCVSESIKREASEFGLDPAKAHVIRPAVDPVLFRRAGEAGADAAPASDDGALRLVMVGWLRWEKGHEYALQALRLLLDRGVPARLEIVGGLPAELREYRGEPERIRHTAADLGLDGHVRLHGEASSADVSGRLKASDVFLHAAVTEGLPSAIVEGMASGLPIVATRCGGVGEAVTDGVEGFLVPPRDTEALADAVARLWEDPGLRARMGQAARARVLAGHTLEWEIDRWEDLYLEAKGA